MYSRYSRLKMITLAVATAALFGCGNGNGDAPLVGSDAKHPANWVAQHGSAAVLSAPTCTECHGAEFSGGITRVGCFSTPQGAYNGFVCHATNPTISLGCSSCHGTIPNGSTAPNRASAHTKHLALAGITCASCHDGAGIGTANHAKATASGGIASATIAFNDPSSIAAKSATPGYVVAGGSCTAIICHGGQATPNWNSGTIKITTDCLKCHEQGTASRTPQFNSFYTGTFPFPNGTVVNLHAFHLIQNDPTISQSFLITCLNCHNTSELATKHFTGLSTPGFEGSAAASVSGGTTSITTYIPFTSAVPSGTCITKCHAVRMWIN